MRAKVWQFPIVASLLSFSIFLNARSAEIQQNRPIAAMDYHGSKSALRYKTMTVVMDRGISHDPDVCEDEQSSANTSCPALVVHGEHGGKPTFEMWGPSLRNIRSRQDASRLQARVMLRWLDRDALAPQVVFVFYTGGAHCCTSSQVATFGADRQWHVVHVGNTDGDFGYAFLDLRHDGTSELVGTDDSFNYQFASYAGSYAPTRIFQLRGSHMVDVTRDPAYRGFLLTKLREMESFRSQNGATEINGYLAAWVAQKALTDGVDGAWQTMLRSYDRGSTDGLTYCRIAEHAWKEATTGDPTCPNGEEVRVAFPEALALFLTHAGYLSPEHSKHLGYDVAEIEAQRNAEIAKATAEFEERKR